MDEGGGPRKKKISNTRKQRKELLQKINNGHVRLKDSHPKTLLSYIKQLILLSQVTVHVHQISNKEYDFDNQRNNNKL